MAQDGADLCADFAALQGVQAIVVMVNNMAQVKAVMADICHVFTPATVPPVMIMSTVSPDQIKALRSRLDDTGWARLEFLDAPVSGAPLLAEAGKLSIMVGGKRTVYQRLKPVLEAIGDPEKIFYLGDQGQGSAMKLINNLLAISIGLNTAEAMQLGMAGGFSADQLAKTIQASSGNNFLIQNWPLTKKMFEVVLHDATYNAKQSLFSIGVKDIEAAQSWAASLGLELASINNTLQQIEQLDSIELDRLLSRMLGN
jgi:3-hydroxyisobutyrate dehydrogenase-like beta-hydroxyacid dehydrogenase